MSTQGARNACQSTGALFKVADLADSLYSATSLSQLSVYALSDSSCAGKLHSSRLLQGSRISAIK